MAFIFDILSDSIEYCCVSQLLSLLSNFPFFSSPLHIIDTFASQFSSLLFFAVPYDDEQQQYHSHAIESRIVLYIYISINRNRIEFDWAVCIDLNFESSACHYETSGSMMWLLLEAAISTTISENVVRNRKNALNEWNCVNIWYANMIVDIFLLNFHICHISFEWFLSVTPNKKRQISNYIDWTQCCHFCCTYKKYIHLSIYSCSCQLLLVLFLSFFHHFQKQSKYFKQMLSKCVSDFDIRRRIEDPCLEWRNTYSVEKWTVHKCAHQRSVFRESEICSKNFVLYRMYCVVYETIQHTHTHTLETNKRRVVEHEREQP